MYFFREIFSFGTKLIRVGSNVNVIRNEVINPKVIIHPKSIIGFISLKIKDKKAIHSSLGAAAFVEAYKGMEGNGNIDEYSNSHPIVRTHPETGKKILYVNSMYTKRIEGLDENESDEILKKLYAHQERLDLTCRFKWTENAVAIWDNRSTQHQGLSDFFPGRGLGHERVMDRVAIEGDQPNIKNEIILFHCFNIFISY